MVEVEVRVDDVLDRLVRDQTMRLGDDLVHALIVGRSFNQHHVVFEVTNDRGIAALDQPEAATEVFSLHSSCGRRSALRGARTARATRGGLRPTSAPRTSRSATFRASLGLGNRQIDRLVELDVGNC